MGVTPAYTTRPRRTQANCLRSALFLTEDGHSPFPAGLFDIVIEGRGTWAAARPAMLQDACLEANESSARLMKLAFSCKTKLKMFDRFGPVTGPRRSNPSQSVLRTNARMS